MYLWAVVLKRLVHLCPYKIAKIEGCCDVHNGDLQIRGEEHGSLRNLTPWDGDTGQAA